MCASASDEKEVTSAKGRARVSGKTSLTHLSVAEAIEVLDTAVHALRRRISEGSIPRKRYPQGRVYVLVGAYSNLPEADHNRQRKPQDEAMIRDLEAQVAYPRTAPGQPGKP